MTDPLNTGIPTLDDRAPAEPSAQKTEEVDWLARARESYQSSTSFFDQNFRKNIENSIRAFNNEHPSDSKYNNPSYEKRSRIYRPKPRSVIRKNEAVAASAFFANMDVVSVTPENEDNERQKVSADIHKALLEYRLNKSIPWFQVVLGGLQDAQTQGWVCANVEWKYRVSEHGMVLEDRPWVDLRPIENIRVDPGAHWYDPVNTSPYFIDMIPMYVCDVHSRMKGDNPKVPKWKEYDDSVIRNAMSTTPDTTRLARQKQAQDPMKGGDKPIGEYEIVWIQRHIHRHYGVDYHFYTLGTEALLTDPIPLKEVVFHGARPYVIGVAILETHKAIPASVPQLGRGLFDEANEIANQRLDNVKFVLNKKFGVKRGRNVDVQAMLRNVPGGVIMADDPQTDITEYNWPDVTSSSYQEQDRINADVDELLGNFSSGSVQTNRKMNETVGGMRMISQSAGTLTEYLLKTYTETFIEPVLRQIIKLEAAYETDAVVLALVSEKAQLFQRYGVDQITDDLLNQELSVRVNVGMGATDPMTKMQKFVSAVQSFGTLLALNIPGLNTMEVGKEIFSHAGYNEGRRFFTSKDPEKDALKQQLQEMHGMMQQLEQKVQDKSEQGQIKAMIAMAGNKTKLAQEEMQQKGENRRTAATILGDLLAEEIKQAQLETQRKTAEADAAKSRADTERLNTQKAQQEVDLPLEKMVMDRLSQLN